MLQQVNHQELERLNQEKICIEIWRVDELEKEEKREFEVDEMWSFVGQKENQRWLWHAIDRRTGKILVYTFVRWKDEVFLELKELLEPFGITQFYTDGLGTY